MAIIPDPAVFARTEADIVDGFPAALAIFLARQDPDMRKRVIDPARNQITGLPVRSWQLMPMALKPGLNIRNAAMVNIAIGSG